MIEHRDVHSKDRPISSQWIAVDCQVTQPLVLPSLTT